MACYVRVLIHHILTSQSPATLPLTTYVFLSVFFSFLIINNIFIFISVSVLTVDVQRVVIEICLVVDWRAAGVAVIAGRGRRLLNGQWRDRNKSRIDAESTERHRHDIYRSIIETFFTCFSPAGGEQKKTKQTNQGWWRHLLALIETNLENQLTSPIEISNWLGQRSVILLPILTWWN